MGRRNEPPLSVYTSAEQAGGTTKRKILKTPASRGGWRQVRCLRAAGELMNAHLWPPAPRNQQRSMKSSAAPRRSRSMRNRSARWAGTPAPCMLPPPCHIHVHPCVSTGIRSTRRLWPPVACACMIAYGMAGSMRSNIHTHAGIVCADVRAQTVYMRSASERQTVWQAVYCL